MHTQTVSHLMKFVYRNAGLVKRLNKRWNIFRMFAKITHDFRRLLSRSQCVQWRWRLLRH